MPATTLCLINQKGGCGKSSTCFHLGGQFALRCYRVLLVDTDPQGSLSQGFFGAERIECLRPSDTLSAIFEDKCFLDGSSQIVPTAFDRLSVVRANHHLTVHNTPCPDQSGLRQFALRAFLESTEAFDFVIIDCPPNLNLSNWNALLAADYVLVPVPPEDFGTQGLRAVLQATEQAAKLNPKLG